MDYPRGLRSLRPGFESQHGRPLSDDGRDRGLDPYPETVRGLGQRYPKGAPLAQREGSAAPPPPRGSVAIRGRRDRHRGLACRGGGRLLAILSTSGHPLPPQRNRWRSGVVRGSPSPLGLSYSWCSVPRSLVTMVSSRRALACLLLGWLKAGQPTSRQGGTAPDLVGACSWTQPRSTMLPAQ